MFNVKIHTDLIELAPQFIENRRRELLAMLEANEQGDSDKLRRINHDIRGVSLSYGFVGLHVLSHALVDKYTDKLTCSYLIKDMLHYLDNVVISEDKDLAF